VTVIWPPPAADIPDEGEDPQSNLLPNPEDLKAMSREERREIFRLIESWEGPLVEWVRQEIRKLDGGA